MRNGLISLSSIIAVAVVAACSGSSKSSFDDPNASSGGVGSSGNNGFGSSGSSGNGAVCAPAKGNFDIPGNNCDDDDDGTVDNPPTCDGSLSKSGSAEDFAKAIGICTKASDAGYGLVSATFTRGYNNSAQPHAEQHGILPKFGDAIKPREGKSLGVLSTGYGDEFDGSPGAAFGEETQGKDWDNFGQYSASKKGNGTAPPGFPKPAAGCQNASQTNDVIDLKLELKAPPNVSGVKFDFNFYSSEWPAFICSNFNDAFIAFLTAKGYKGGAGDNMSFDKNQNPVSVNNGFFDRCTPNVQVACADDPFSTKKSQCPGGPGELAGTGFGITGKYCPLGGDTSTAGGATGWLTSQAPVQAGETFTLEFIIWDTGDAILDSSVLIDNFTWAAGKVDVQTDRPH